MGFWKSEKTAFELVLRSAWGLSSKQVARAIDHGLYKGRKSIFVVFHQLSLLRLEVPPQLSFMAFQSMTHPLLIWSDDMHLVWPGRCLKTVYVLLTSGRIFNDYMDCIKVVCKILTNIDCLLTCRFMKWLMRNYVSTLYGLIHNWYVMRCINTYLISHLL